MKLLSIALVAFSTPLNAAERTFSIADFDRLHVVGNFVVEVAVDRATTAKAIGNQAALEATSLVVEGRTLSVRQDRANWTGSDRVTAPATIRLTVPALTNVWVTGSATVRVAAMRGMRIGLSLDGSGTLDVARVTGDRLDIGMLGAGRITAAGKAASITVVTRGAGELDTAGLATQDAKVSSDSAGNTIIRASRVATVKATGAGQVTVLGKPACTVDNTGSGNVVCGSDQP